MNIEKRICRNKIFSASALFVLLAFVLGASCEAGFEKQQQSSRGIGMGNSLTALSDGASSIFYNPAGVKSVLTREVSFFYSPAPFGINEFAQSALAYIEPTTFGVFGLSLQTTGFDLYREMGVGISYANEYQGFQYGLTLNYLSLSIERYGAASVVSVDLGVAADITNQIRLGAVVYNINQPGIGSVDERLPLIFSAGFAYTPLDDLHVTTDLQKDIHYPVNLRFGIEYSPVEVLQLRIGNTTEPARFSAGVGLRYEFLQFDYALQTHTELSATHSASLRIRFSVPK